MTWYLIASKVKIIRRYLMHKGQEILDSLFLIVQNTLSLRLCRTVIDILYKDKAYVWIGGLQQLLCLLRTGVPTRPCRTARCGAIQ